jgi:RHS repeat-associated protein
MSAGRERELTSVRAVRGAAWARLVAQALVVALQLTMLPPALFARPARAEDAHDAARQTASASVRVDDASARPQPQASQPESAARLAAHVGERPSHAWVVGRVLLASLRSLLLRLAPIAPQTGGGGPPAALVTRAHTLPAGWSLVAVPLQPADPSATAVFDELPAPLRLYDTVNGQLLSPDEPGFRPVSAGRAFWTVLEEPVTVSATGTPVSTSTPQAVPLVTGWNAVSTPWLTPVPWTDARVSVRRGSETVPLTDAVIRGWIDGDLTAHDAVTDTFTSVPPNATPAGELVPWRGGLVFAHGQADLVFGVPPPDVTPPVVSFATPAEGADISQPTDVVGSVDDPNLLEWSLAYSLGSTAPFLPLATGTGPVLNGSLGSLDPTLSENGPVVLRLSAIDAAGNVASVQRTVLLSGNAKVGIFQLRFRDLDVPVAGIPITVVRTYDSRRRAAVGDFGFGWSVEVEGLGRYTNNRKPGDGWQFVTQVLPCRSVNATKPHYTEVRLSDREFYRFALNVTSPAPVLGGCFGTASFTPAGGYPGSATLQILGSTEVFWQNGTDQLVDLDTFEVYEPRDVRLVLPTGRTYDLTLGRGITRVADSNGNSLLLGPGGVVHSSGRSVSFTRDGAGRITRITDPLGNAMSYAYGATGDLESFTDRENNATTFTYSAAHPHLLEAVRDPRGVQPIRNEYDEDGRLVRQVDAFGKDIEFAHDVEGRREVVTDRLGHTRVLEHDESGNVTVERDALGHPTTRTFDSSGNRLTETNALGQTTNFAYDANDNVTSLRDPLGNVSSVTYNARNQVLTTTDARGKVRANTYDAAGNPLTIADAQGNTVTYTYDARGNVLTLRDALGNLVTRQYDANGYMTRETTAAGVTAFTYDVNGNRLSQTVTRATPTGTETLVTTLVYDKMGRLTQATDPDGTITRTTYDATGRPATVVDKLGRTTSYVHDEMGRLTRTTYPDGTTEESTYDDEGRRLTGTDRGGRITRYEYDPVGRLTRTTFADGAVVTSGYDAVGQLVSSRDARGNTTTYEYDAGGRRTRATDAAGNATTFTYDENGALATVTDPRGQTTRYEVDDRGLQTRTVFADGTFASTAYDAAGQRVGVTDQAGLSTQFAYDALGRLTGVTDAAGEVTAFAYDELGHRVSQTDANGRVTRFEYDAAGRLTRRVLPDGRAETFTYDVAGRLAARTDFAGRLTTYAYDLAGRLTSRAYPDGSSTAFTYTPSGRRATATDARGTTTYTYDARDRMSSSTYPDGRRLDYTYDAAGNRTSLRATLGAAVFTTGYAYDRLNRLEAVTDPAGRVYGLGYDANGNRTSLAHPNGVATTYAYSALNRLTSLTSQRASVVVQSYTYTLGPAGNRTQVQEADGTTRQYAHDDLFRLTGETVSGPVSYTKAFTYDAVGNRLSQTTNGAGAPGTPTAPGAISYSYDSRDRLLTDGAIAQAHDDNGNLVTRTGEATYAWDFENRLTRVTRVDGTLVEHAYDADGNRVQTRITPATGPPLVTNYLVDTAGELSHAVVETDGVGAVRATYVRAGAELLAVMRGGGTRFYHADGSGSVRRLTDEVGGVTDEYSYTAFGERIAHTGADPQPYAFAGEPFDPDSGFQYHRARWLDPRVGRFTAMDPVAGTDFDPPSLHTYLYAKNGPVEGSDPTGLFMMVDFSVANSIRSTLAGIQSNIGFALIDQILYGGSAGIDSLLVGAAITVGAGAVIVGVSKLGLRLLRSPGFKRWSDRLFKARGIRPSVGAYEDVVGAVPGLQANHINQNAAFESVIPRAKGAAVGMRGNAITDIGSPHYEFHKSLESWWDQFRKGGARHGEFPTCGEYDTAVREALERSGFDGGDVSALADFAAANRRDYGLVDSSLVPNIPGRLNQKK